MENEEIFNSIFNSQRQFKKLHLDTTKVTKLQHLYRLNTICFKFGLDITELLWDSCKLTKAQIVTLLNFMPNLESLSAIAWRLQSEPFDEPAPMLNLQRLEKLKVTKSGSFNPSDEPTIEFFSKFLPKNLIRDLDLRVEHKNFLANQQSVEKLKFLFYSENSEYLHSLKLSELKLIKGHTRDISHNSFIKTIIEHQPDLSALDILGCEECFDENDAAFVAVTDLKKLQSLKINIDDLSPTIFMEHFSKLKNLKELQIENHGYDYAAAVLIVEELSRLKMRHLEVLFIHLADVGVPLDRIARIGKNFAGLKNFTIICNNPLPLDCYLENMNQLEKLSIEYHYSREFSTLVNNFDIKCERLRELTLSGFSFASGDISANEPILLKLPVMLPNLKTLDLGGAAFPLNMDIFQIIIEEFKHLKVLRNWSMTQSGDNYRPFTYQSVASLKRMANLLNKFSIDLRLKVATLEVDVSKVRDDLQKEFNVQISRVGNFIVFKIDKC